VCAGDEYVEEIAVVDDVAPTKSKQEAKKSFVDKGNI